MENKTAPVQSSPEAEIKAENDDVNNSGLVESKKENPIEVTKTDNAEKDKPIKQVDDQTEKNNDKENEIKNEEGDNLEDPLAQGEQVEEKQAQGEQIEEKHAEGEVAKPTNENADDQNANSEIIEGEDAGKKVKDEQKDGEQVEGEHVENKDEEGDQVESEHRDGENVEGENDEGELVEGENVEGELVKGENVEGEHIEGEHVEGEHVEGEHVEGEHVEGEHVEGEHVEGELVEGEHIEGEHTEGKLVEGEETKQEQLSVEDEATEGEQLEGEAKGEGDVEEETKEGDQAAVDIFEEDQYEYYEALADPAAPYDLTDSKEALRPPFHLRPDQEAELESLWELYQDYTPAYTDLDNYITSKELIYMLKSLNLMTNTPEQLQELIDFCVRPQHYKGHIYYDQFVHIVKLRLRDITAEEELRFALQVMDPDGTAIIDKEFLKDVLLTKGNKMGHRALDNLIKEVDISQDGTIGIEDVVGTMAIDLNTEDLEMLRAAVYPSEKAIDVDDDVF